MSGDERFFDRKTRKAMSVIVVLIALFLLVLLIQMTNAPSAVDTLFVSLQSVFFGLLFTCILAPLVNGFEDIFKRRFSTPEKPRTEFIRVLSVILSMSILIAALISILFLIIPQIGITISKIIPGFGNMVNNLNEWLKGLSDAQFWQERVYPFIGDAVDGISTWLLGNFGVGTDVYYSLTHGIAFAFGVAFNFLIGLIMAIYILMSKERLFAQMRKFNKALFKDKWGGFVNEALEEGARIFTGFFGAKILEAGIMGLMCFAGMLIFRFPYGTLISVIVGIANIIPFFGPYIGAILGAAIIMLVSPWQALGFIIFQIILVQVDANLIGPKILGHSTGLSAFWVIVSILIFSKCFGFVGAMIGVPVFAWIYYVVKKFTEYSLRKQGLETETEDYIKPIDLKSKHH